MLRVERLRKSNTESGGAEKVDILRLEGLDKSSFEGGGADEVESRCFICRKRCSKGLSHRMHLLISFRKSTAPQNRQLIDHYY